MFAHDRLRASVGQIAAARARVRLARILLVCLATIPVFEAAAQADVASDIQSHLTRSGIAAQVSVATPPPAAPNTAEQVSEPADTEVRSVDSMKPFLSPDPTSPLPVIEVEFSLDPGERLAGLLEASGADLGTTTTPTLLEAELAVTEAMKHTMLSGFDVAGVQMTIGRGDELPSIELLQAAPNLAIVQRPRIGTPMPPEQVRERAIASLPTWARTHTTVEVEEDAAGERIVKAAVALPPWVFRALDVSEITAALDRLQIEAALETAAIGRTTVRATDSTTGDPLYSSANDASFGYFSEWRSPLVAAFTGGSKALTPEETQDAFTSVDEESKTADPVTEQIPVP